MNKRSLSVFITAILTVSSMVIGCKNNAHRPINGTMDHPIIQGNPPESVETAMKHISQIDDNYETLMEDKTNGISVYSLIRCSDEVSSEGYGMVVAKGNVKTALPNLRHGKMPCARYDAATGDLWIVGNDMEGTGAQVEHPYLMHFDKNGYAVNVASIDPFEIQQAFCQELTYTIDGQGISFYAKGQPLTTVINHVEDMGEFKDDAIYIGEQIAYSVEGPLTVHVTPGINFVTSNMLIYDDMPTFSATVTLKDDSSFTLGDIKAEF